MGQAIDNFIELYRQGKIPEKTIIKMAAFAEELEKVGAGKQNVPRVKTLKGLGVTLLAGMALGAGAHLMTKGMDAVVSKLDEKNKPILFAEMLRLHPELLTMADRQKVQNYFDTVWHFSPHLAKNPFAAGSYIRHALVYDESLGGPPITNIKELSGIEKDVKDRKDKTGLPDYLAQPFIASAKEMKLQPEDIPGMTTRMEN